jgi:hypothetical protein
MSKKTKNSQTRSKSKSSISNYSNSSQTIRSLQNSLNKISDQFKFLKNEDFILKHRLKSKKFTNLENDLQKVISDNYLISFINNVSSSKNHLFQNLNHRINLPNFSLKQDVTELIAKEAIVIFKNYKEFKIPKSKQINSKI